MIVFYIDMKHENTNSEDYTISRSYLMRQSHCAESVPKRGRMDHSSLSGVSFLVIPVHSYPFE